MISRERLRHLTVGAALVASVVACDADRPTSGPTLTDPATSPAASTAESSAAAPSTTWSPAPTSRHTTTTSRTRGPGTGASIDAVVRWIDAAVQVGDAGFHIATDWRTPGPTTVPDTLFRLPAPIRDRSTGGCGISRYLLDTVSCLPGIGTGLPRPDGLNGQWIGSWVDFTGTRVTVGSLHGDPGVFNSGYGEPVPYGTAVTARDYRCRPAEEGMYCRSLSRRSAVLMGREFGVYGCREVAPPTSEDGHQYVGREFTCG